MELCTALLDRLGESTFQKNWAPFVHAGRLLVELAWQLWYAMRACVVGTVRCWGVAVDFVSRHLKTCLFGAEGAGSLSLPFAFKQGGVLFAFLLTISIGALSSYTVILLKRCEEAVAAKTPYAGLASVEPDAPAASPRVR